MRKTPQHRETHKAKQIEKAEREAREEPRQPAKRWPRGAVPVRVDRLGPCNSLMPPDFVRRGHYIDEPFTCRGCGKPQVWTAHQQRWWYEIARGEQTTGASRCRDCRRTERAQRNKARATHLDGVRRKLGLRGEWPVPSILRTPGEGEDAEWLALVRRILGRTLAIQQPAELHLIGTKDCFFSKCLKTMESSKGRVFLPSFLPDQIAHESHWIRNEASAAWKRTNSNPLYAWSTEDGIIACRPSALLKGPATAYCWVGFRPPRPNYSGRATLMFLFAGAEKVKTWHAEFCKEDAWRLDTSVGLSSAAMMLLMEDEST